MDSASTGDDRLARIRDELLRWKREARDRDTKICISELLDIIDEGDREDARFAEWCQKHAPNWDWTPQERQLFLAFLLNGNDGLSGEEAYAAYFGKEPDLSRVNATPGSLRNRLSEIRERLRASKSTVQIRGDHHGVYRTHDPSIVTLGEVSPPSDR
jgi:hypothetical protein